MKRKLLISTVATVILVSMLAACGASDGNGSNGDVVIVGTTDQVTASPEAPAPLDPAYAYDIATWNILRQTVQTLMIQPKGGGGPVPEAAEQCGFTDGQSRRYVCTLRKGLRFADGKPITSKDVKFSVDRALSIQADSGVFSILSTVESVETQGERKVIFHLSAPDATFPFKLSTPVAGIVSSRKYEKSELHPGFDVDGSGPYTMEAHLEGGELLSATFFENPHYKGTLKRSSEKIELRFFADAASMSAAFDESDIDIMTRTMSSSRIRELAQSSADNVNLVELPGLEIRYLAFDTDAPSVENKAVRQAMAQVIDRSELVSKVYGTQADPLYSLVPASLSGHVNSFMNKYGEPNSGAARSLLKKAGVTTPVKLTLHYTTDHYGPQTKQEFSILRQQLNATGLFDITVAGTSWKDFRPAQMKGNYDVYGMGWFPDYPDAESYIAPFLDKDNTLNLPYFSSRIRNVLLPESRSHANRIDAVPSLTAIQDIVAEDVPLLPLWQGKQYVGAGNYVTGAAYVVNTGASLQLGEIKRGIKE
ncbi:peptide-binding protein [Streptomyces sp. RM72]|uniref:ABC transporter substrate-binding protein n=1 Tax=Streptomyces sp. RM72 TaxID=1115510 RepID=UPI001B35C06C|nr:ABC transporter substrate-binding protein [Streptomyces sp. RM72]MBQ0891410.1 peptide-binding protein [Streptomyces sp. RM72]